MTHDELLAKINRYNDGIEEGLIWTTDVFIKALRAVVELHRPSGIFCRGCGFVEEYNEPAQLLPCPTIQAIEKELA
jgi:hypothetical protein